MAACGPLGSANLFPPSLPIFLSHNQSAVPTVPFVSQPIQTITNAIITTTDQGHNLGSQPRPQHPYGDRITNISKRVRVKNLSRQNYGEQQTWFSVLQSSRPRDLKLQAPNNLAGSKIKKYPLFTLINSFLEIRYQILGKTMSLF